MLRQSGDRWFVDGPSDLSELLNVWASDYGHEPIAEYAVANCSCGGRKFLITLADHGEKVSLRCEACGERLLPISAAQFASGDETEERTCVGCGQFVFEICAGFAPYSLFGPENSGSCFMGGWCVNCGAAGIYANWVVPTSQSTEPIWRTAARVHAMTEAEWLTCTHPEPMLDFVASSADHRATRLFGVAACRRIWSLLTDERSHRAIDVAEQFAMGRATESDLAAAYEAALQAHEAAGEGFSPDTPKGRVLEAAQCSAWDGAMAAPTAAFLCARPVLDYWAVELTWMIAVARAYAEMSEDIASYFAALEAEYAALAELCRSRFAPFPNG